MIPRSGGEVEGDGVEGQVEPRWELVYRVDRLHSNYRVHNTEIDDCTGIGVLLAQF